VPTVDSDRTYAAIVASPARSSQTGNQPANVEAADDQESITITIGAKTSTTKTHSQPLPTHNDADHNTGFKAARRKNITSYFVGNIDNDVTKQDIYNYMKHNGIKPTLINIYYGRNGAAAKVNIHADDEYKANDEQFWPSEIVFRKWVTKEEWDREKTRFRRKQHPDRHQHWRQHSTERRERDPYTDRGYRHQTHRSGNQRRGNRYADRHTGNSYRFYTHDDTDNEDQPRSDNEYDRAYEEY